MLSRNSELPADRREPGSCTAAGTSISSECMQADPPCHWFGSPCPCLRYIIIASAIGFLTFTYLLASIAITLGEKKLSERVLWAGITCAPITRHSHTAHASTWTKRCSFSYSRWTTDCSSL